MHFSCLVITEQRPDDGSIDDLMWPWCLSNEERRDAKADYWEIGGRYAQMFSVDDAPVEITSWDFVGPGNQLAKRDVPFERLAERAAATKAAVYDQAQAVLATRRFGFWKKRLKLPDLASLEKQHGMTAAHDIFQADPAVRAIRRTFDEVLLAHDIAALARPREEVLAAARRQAVLTYAVVRGDSWHECKGPIVAGGPPSAWEHEFAALLDAADPSCWLTVVDCHR